MTDERPTTMLHDAWGPSRPATDAELAEIRRMDTMINIGTVAVGGLLAGGIGVLIYWLVAG